MGGETFIQEQIKIVKNKKMKNEKSLSELLSEAKKDFDAEETSFSIENINQEYLFDICSILKNRVNGIQRLNIYAYYVANSEDISEYTKLEILKEIEDKYQQTINIHDFFLTFEFPDYFINDLKYIFEVNKEIIPSEDIIDAIATAFVKVQHYRSWCEKHKIQDKHFRTKKEQILREKEELERFSFKEIDLHLPFYPQDILLDFVDTYSNEIPKNIMGVIVELIGDKSKLPKPSKHNEYDAIRQKVDIEINKLIEREGLSPKTLEKIVTIKKKNFQQ